MPKLADFRGASRRRAVALTAVLVTGGSIVLAGGSPQVAAQPSANVWPAKSYTPVCGTVFREPTRWHYYDLGAPIIKSFSAPQYIALTASARTVTLSTSRVTDACSGLGEFDVTYTLAGTFYPVSLVPPVDHWFDEKMLVRRSLSVTTLGRVAWQSLAAAGRYNDFFISLDHKTLIDSTPKSGGPEIFTTKELSDVTFLVRKTYLTTPALSRSSVHTGADVTVSSHLTVATSTTQANLSSVRALLEFRPPRDGWAVLSSTLTSARGKATFHINPTRSGYYRVVYAGRFASPWNAPVTSAKVRVSVS